MSDIMEEPRQIDRSFLQGVAHATTSYSEGWRDTAARLLWCEAELVRRQRSHEQVVKALEDYGFTWAMRTDVRKVLVYCGSEDQASAFESAVNMGKLGAPPAALAPGDPATDQTAPETDRQ